MNSEHQQPTPMEILHTVIQSPSISSNEKAFLKSEIARARGLARELTTRFQKQ